MKELNFKQELTAAFGQPISENPTQVMVEAAYRHHKLDWRYLTIEVGPDDLEEAVRGAKVMGFQGFNCTIPHKVKVIEYLDDLGESASLMGAVNCVVRRDGKWIERKYRRKGFVSSLQELTDPKGKRWLSLVRVRPELFLLIALAGASQITIVNRPVGGRINHTSSRKAPLCNQFLTLGIDLLDSGGNRCGNQCHLHWPLSRSGCPDQFRSRHPPSKYGSG